MYLLAALLLCGAADTTAPEVQELGPVRTLPVAEYVPTILLPKRVDARHRSLWADIGWTLLRANDPFGKPHYGLVQQHVPGLGLRSTGSRLSLRLDGAAADSDQYRIEGSTHVHLFSLGRIRIGIAVDGIARAWRNVLHTDDTSTVAIRHTATVAGGTLTLGVGMEDRSHVRIGPAAGYGNSEYSLLLRSGSFTDSELVASDTDMVLVGARVDGILVLNRGRTELEANAVALWASPGSTPYVPMSDWSLRLSASQNVWKRASIVFVGRVGPGHTTFLPGQSVELRLRWRFK